MDFSNLTYSETKTFSVEDIYGITNVSMLDGYRFVAFRPNKAGETLIAFDNLTAVTSSRDSYDDKPRINIEKIPPAYRFILKSLQAKPIAGDWIYYGKCSGGSGWYQVACDWQFPPNGLGTGPLYATYERVEVGSTVKALD